ncbi:MAG: hypothetical protein K6E87_02050 [bacterium]|nr:hypothetical protein [bacterium]
MYDSLIKYGIAFGPTILFALIVLIRVIIGYFSGARRQVIFMIHSFVAFTICVIIFYVLVNNKSFDKFILDVVNKFMGEDGLENALGVSPACTTMREVLVQYIPSQMNFVDGLELILRDNGAYLLTLVNVSYHVILALVLYYVYLLLEGIFFIIYLICYSERKHIRKKNERYANGLEDTPYHKHKKYGAGVGLFRGLVKGMIFITIIGTQFFIISGIGTKNRKKYSTNNQTIDLGFTIYREIGNYGEHGIYKVLNMVKDKDDVPYYLYAIDLVFQGGLKDEARGIDKNIYLREELNAYVEFSTDTFDLLLEYGGDDITKIILGEYEGNVTDAILKIMADPRFQAEFKLLIDNFDSKTYFINFALSLVDSISANLENVSFTQNLNADAIDVMNIAFKRGYLSNTIEFERNLKIINPNTELGYIKPSSILNANDGKMLLNAILDIITLNEKYGKNKDYALRVIDALTKYINKMSIINTDRSDELNPVLKRLYAYLDAKYLSKSAYENNNSDEELKMQRHISDIVYKDEYYDNIDWVKELNNLVASLDDILIIYEDVFIGDRDGFSATLAIFDKDNANYERNIELYHNLINNLSDSKLLGEAASSIIVTSSIEKYIRENVFENYRMPSKMNYANIEKDGVTYYGELYYFLTGLEKVINNDKNINLIDLISNSSDLTEDEAFDLMVDLSNVLASNDGDQILAENLLNSKILHSLFSSYILTNNNVSDDFSIYIDNSIIKDYVIDYNELVSFFKKAPGVLELVRPIIEDETEDTKTLIDLLKSDEAKDALESIIFEGTFSSMMYSNLKNDDTVVFPEFFKNQKRWVTIKQESSEIKRLIKALNETSFDLYAVIDGDNEKAMDSMKNLTELEVDIMLDSGILYYSISKYLVEKGETLIDKMPLIVPNVVLINDPSGSNYRIELNNLKVFLRNVKHFIFEDDNINVTKLMKDMLNNQEVLDNNIYSATISHSISSDDGLIHKNLNNSLKIPESMKTIGDSIEYLRENFTSSNPWKKETKNLINGIEYLIKISEKEDDYDFENKINDDIKQELKYLNNQMGEVTRLEGAYLSYILANTLTEKVYDAFAGKDLVEDSTLDLNKDSRGIYNIGNVEGIIWTINYYDVDIDNVSNETIDSIKNDILTDEFRLLRLHNMYKSCMIKDVLTTRLDEVIFEKVIKPKDKMLVADSNDFYYEDEVRSLLTLLKYLGFNDASELDNDELVNQRVKDVYKDEDKLPDERLEELYIDKNNNLKYNITGIIFTNKVENNVDIPTVVLEYVKGKKRKLSLEEVKCMRKALKALDVDIDRDDEDEQYLNSLLIKLKNSSDNKMNIINSSYVVRSLITTEIINNSKTEEKPNKVIVHTDKAFEFGLEIYSKEEIKALISVINHTTGDAPLDEIDDLVFNDEIANLINESYLFAATLTDKMLHSNVVITKDEFDYFYRLMYKEKLSLFVEGLRKMIGDFSIKTFDINDMLFPSDEFIHDIASSHSLMATITYNIKIYINPDPNPKQLKLKAVDDTYCVITNGVMGSANSTDIKYNVKVTYITENEFRNIIKLLRDLDPENKVSKTTISNMDTLIEDFGSNIGDITSYPNIVYNIINDYIISNFYIFVKDNIEYLKVVTISDSSIDDNAPYINEEVMQELINQFIN